MKRQQVLFARALRPVGTGVLPHVSSVSPETAKLNIITMGSVAVFEYIATGLKHVLIGYDPLDIEGAWRRMYMGSIYYGRRGVALHAMSGIDIALWDIKGKKLGKSVAELLGVKMRTRIRPYASLLMPNTEREVAAPVDYLAEMTFPAINLG